MSDLVDKTPEAPEKAPKKTDHSKALREVEKVFEAYVVDIDNSVRSRQASEVAANTSKHHIKALLENVREALS